MIVNDWNARKAYYSRSADGFHWVAEDGLAYDIEVSVHPDGTREQWYKYERPRVFQDKYGRAIQLNMAVIDTIKAQDVANDNHSSKNIAMPLNPGLRLFVLNDSPISTSTSAIQVKVMAEDGFTPATDLDIESLRFGGYATVNNGGGAAVQSSETDSDGNLILTFNGANTGIKSDEFAPKLLGKYRNGYTMTNEAGKAMAPAFCYGYAKLPYYKYTPAYLSPVLPTVGEGSNLTTVRIDNCGLSASTEGQVVKVLTTSGTVLATGTVTSLAAYESAVVELTSVRSIPSGQTSLVVAFYDGSTKTDSHTLLLTDINALQAKLSAKYNEALQLYNNEAYANGRIAMNAALTEAKSHLQSYYEPEITSAMEALQGAMAQFVSDNPDVPNITCRNYYLKPATINSGNTYMYVSADGTLARKNSYDASSIFTLIVDGDNNRTYLYNPSSKTFVVAKVGSGTSFWTASAANAYCLGGIAASNTTTDAYTIKGDATSTNAFNYLNAYGGANHTELCSYTQDNSGSQWTLVEADDQTYTFDVTNVTTGLDAFLATAKRISKAVITPSVTAVSQIKTTPCAKSKPQYYTLTGQSVAQSYKGVVVCQGKKYIQ